MEESEEELKSLLMKVKEESEKVGLKLNMTQQQQQQQNATESLDESERGEWKSWLKTQHSEN